MPAPIIDLSAVDLSGVLSSAEVFQQRLEDYDGLNPAWDGKLRPGFAHLITALNEAVSALESALVSLGIPSGDPYAGVDLRGPSPLFPAVETLLEIVCEIRGGPRYFGLGPPNCWTISDGVGAYVQRVRTAVPILRQFSAPLSDRWLANGALPDNPDLVPLAKLIKARRGLGESKNAIALEFTNGNPQRAASLLRQLRRYPHLLEE
jgi:hypothetical protein